MHDGIEIAVAELGVGGVDPNVEEAGARFSIGGGDRLAGRRLLGDGDRVLKVEDHRVGVEGQRLLDPALMVAGGEEETAQRHRCFPQFPSEISMPRLVAGRAIRSWYQRLTLG